MRLMIVDDSPVMRSFVRRTLDLAGLAAETCLEASNGAEALRELEQVSVDLILTDVNMPVMDGEALLRALRGREDLRGIPVIVVTTDSTQHRAGELLALGARGYLKKPFPPEKLGEALREVLPDLAQPSPLEF